MPAARPARAPRADNRLPLILDEAARLFAAQGFHGASVRDIVRAIDMLPGSLYYHFTTKEALLAAVYAEGVRRISESVEAAIAGRRDPWERLEAACVAHLESLLGAGDYAHDIRLACHGLDKDDNDFVVGLIGKDLYPLSAIVQTMRKTQAEFVAALLSSLGPNDRFNVGVCDVDATWLFPEAMHPTEDALNQVREQLEQRVSLGWTNLDAAVQSALAKATTNTQIVYVGDGIPATVESVEYFGADSIVVCRVGDTSGVAVRVSGHLRARAGEALRLSWPQAQQHFFAADSAVINTVGH